MKGQVGVFRNPYYADLEFDGLRRAGDELKDNDAIIGTFHTIQFLFV